MAKDKPKSRVVVVERRNGREEREGDAVGELDRILEESDRAQEQEERDEAKVQEFFSQFSGGSYQVRVERLNEEKKRWEHVALQPYDGFDPYSFCEPYGPGDYQFNLVNEHGKYVKSGFRPRITISAVVAKAKPAERAPEEADPLKHPMVALMLQQSQERSRDMMAMMQALAGRPEPVKPATGELVDALAKLQALSPKPEDTAKKLMDALMPILLERALNPDKEAGDGDSVASQIKDVLEAANALGPVLAKVRPGARQVPASELAPADKVLSHQPNPQGQAVRSPIESALRSIAPQFLRWAKRGEDFDYAAEELIACLEDEIVPLVVEHYRPLGMRLSSEAVWAELVKRAQEPAEVEVIFTSAPEFVPYREWVLKVLAAALDQMTKPEAAPTAKPEAPADGAL